LSKFLSNKDISFVILTLLKIEVGYYLNLINYLKKDLNRQNEEINDIINLLEVNMLEVYLTNQHKNDSILTKLFDKKTDYLDHEKDDLIVNIIVKIKILKSINSLPYQNKNGYKKFRLKQRVDFLRDKLLNLLNVLDFKLEELKS
jgi:hypothetical protein